MKIILLLIHIFSFSKMQLKLKNGEKTFREMQRFCINILNFFAKFQSIQKRIKIKIGLLFNFHFQKSLTFTKTIT